MGRSLIFPLSIASAVVGLAAAAANAAPASLLVSNVGTNQILQFDATTGAFDRVFAQDPSMQAPFGMAYGPDGNLYVAGLGTGTILRFNGTTGAAMPGAGQTGANFVAPHTFQYPNTIAFVGNTLYVTDFTANMIRTVDVTTGTVGNFVTVTSTATGGAHPTGMIWDGNANDTVDGQHFYVSVSNPADQDHIAQINLAGTTQVNFNHNGTPGTTLVAPAGLALQPAATSGGQGTLWASSFDNAAANPAVGSHVVGYNYNLSNGNDGNISLDIASSGSVVLNQPAGLALDPTGAHLFVVNSGLNNILEFNTSNGAPTNGTDGVFIAGGSHGLNTPTYILYTTTANTTGVASVAGIGTESINLPEPSSVVLLGMGAVGLVGYYARRRLQSAA